MRDGYDGVRIEYDGGVVDYVANGICIETATQAAAIIRAALPKEQKEERVFVLPRKEGS